MVFDANPLNYRFKLLARLRVAGILMNLWHNPHQETTTSKTIKINRKNGIYIMKLLIHKFFNQHAWQSTDTIWRTLMGISAITKMHTFLDTISNGWFGWIDEHFLEHLSKYVMSRCGFWIEIQAFQALLNGFLLCFALNAFFFVQVPFKLIQHIFHEFGHLRGPFIIVAIVEFKWMFQQNVLLLLHKFLLVLQSKLRAK